MTITLTELRKNPGKYLILSAMEDIFITRKGKVISKLTNPFKERVDTAKTLFGVIQGDITLDKSKEERLESI